MRRVSISVVFCVTLVPFFSHSSYKQCEMKSIFANELKLIRDHKATVKRDWEIKYDTLLKEYNQKTETDKIKWNKDRVPGGLGEPCLKEKDEGNKLLAQFLADPDKNFKFDADEFRQVLTFEALRAISYVADARSMQDGRIVAPGNGAHNRRCIISGDAARIIRPSNVAINCYRLPTRAQANERNMRGAKNENAKKTQVRLDKREYEFLLESFFQNAYRPTVDGQGDYWIVRQGRRDPVQLDLKTCNHGPLRLERIPFKDFVLINCEDNTLLIEMNPDAQ